MNIQVHSVISSSPYELVFGQKPHSVLFPSGKSKGPLLEEDLETDGTTVEAEPLKLTEADVPLEEDGNEHDGSEQEGKRNKGPLLEKDQAGEEESMKLSRKWQWEEEGEEKAKSKKTCLQQASLSQDATEGQEVAVKEYPVLINVQNFDAALVGALVWLQSTIFMELAKRSLS